MSSDFLGVGEEKTLVKEVPEAINLASNYSPGNLPEMDVVSEPRYNTCGHLATA